MLLLYDVLSCILRSRSDMISNNVNISHNLINALLTVGNGKELL